MNDQSDAHGDHEVKEKLNHALGEQVREELGDETVTEIYERMRLIRRFERHAGRAYQKKKIRGFCHLYTGQEAVAVGAMNAVTDDDYIVTAYREHGHALARGLPPDRVMAELFAKKEGVSEGKGGSMHLFDVDKNFYGGWAIVGGQLPTATGVGFAIDYRNEDLVCLCFMGEGTVHQGSFHESLNLASKWDLPVVYIIENNWYAMGTALDRVSATTKLEKKAGSYDMEGTTVDDGQDIFEVYTSVKEAVDRARQQKRPTLLDVKTYRFKGHSMTDPGTYRSKEEIERERRRDPVERLRTWLVENSVCTEQQVDEIDERCETRVQEALEFAEEADFPDQSELTTDVYAEWPAKIR